MEVIAAIAVISAVMLLLGFKAMTLLLIGLGILGLLFVLTNIFFIWFFVKMLRSKRTEASFTRIDKSPRSPFKVAYYLVEGSEYPNIFPEEGFLESKLYKKDKTYHVLLDRKKKYVYDRFAVTTCTIGTFFSTGVSAAAILLLTGVL